MTTYDHILAAETPAFARAVRAIITGNLPGLHFELAAMPALIHARSVSMHQATLLHYVAANGVEEELQRPTRNAAAIARALVGTGAKIDALSFMHGRRWTTMELVVSSEHLYNAFVTGTLVRSLCDLGAAVDGPLNDGAPLEMALAFGILDAVQAVLGCGARTNNPIFAASAGDTAWLGAWLDGAAETAAQPLPVYLPLSSDRATAAEQALLFAAMCGQVDVIRLLLDRGVDVNAYPPGSRWTATALHTAAVQGHAEVVSLLLSRGADPTIKDGGSGGTPLEWTKIARSPRRPGALAVAQILGQ